MPNFDRSQPPFSTPVAATTPRDALRDSIGEAMQCWAVRMALTREETGAVLELLFALLGHDRILLRIGAVSSHLLHGRGLEPIKYGLDGRPFKPIAGVKPAP